MRDALQSITDATARIGQLGRYFEMRRAVCPVSVRTMMRDALQSITDATAAEQTDSGTVTRPVAASEVSFMWLNRSGYAIACSAVSQMRRIVATAFKGKAPPAVSPESITTSDPSKTAFATSEASARVGRGLPV